jgi:vitamin B12 transporter
MRGVHPAGHPPLRPLLRCEVTLRSTLTALLALPLLSLPCRAARAADSDESSAPYRLGEIVVSGRASGVEAAQDVSTVTAEDIRAKDARTLDQALDLLPGINVRLGNEGVPRIDVRGFRTRHVQLLLDGVPLNSAFDQQFDPSVIATENIAEIKVTEGPSSVLYGQGALGGVINIITKKGTRGLRASFGAEAGDREPYLVRGTASGGKGPVDFFVGGSSNKLSGFRLPSDFEPTSEQGAGIRLNSDRQRNNVLGNVGFTPTENLTLGLTASFAQGYFGKPTSIFNRVDDPFAAPPRYERVDDFENASIQGAADWQATGRLAVRAWAFANHLDEQDNAYTDRSFTATLTRNHVTSTIVGGSVQPRYDLGRAGVLTLMGSAEGDGWDDTGSMPASNSFNIYSVAIQYEVSPLPRLGLAAGYGHHWQVGSDRHEDGTSAMGSVYYDLFPETRLKATVSRNIRFPTLRDLYDPSQGNPRLAAERAYTYQGGIEQRLPWNSVATATGFYTVAKNLIQQDQLLSRRENLAEVRFSGVELTGSTRPLRTLLVRGSYTYLQSEDRSRAGRQEQQYTPRHKLTFEGKYEFPFGLSPYVWLSWTGDQYYYTRNNVTPVQKGRLGNIFLVGVKISQRLLPDRLWVYVGATNLLDWNYESSYGLPQPGRFVYGGLELRL